MALLINFADTELEIVKNHSYKTKAKAHRLIQIRSYLEQIKPLENPSPSAQNVDIKTMNVNAILSIKMG